MQQTLQLCGLLVSTLSSPQKKKGLDIQEPVPTEVQKGGQSSE